VGEGLQARPVLEALRRAHPDWQLAYTWFSPSADQFAARLDVDLREVLPFDGVREANALLEAWQPDVLAFTKLDVWPVLAERAAARGVRTALISATLASNSSRQGFFARALLHDAYASLHAVGAIASEDATRLVQLGVRADRISVTGDTRMDQVWQRAQSVTPSHKLRVLLAPSDQSTVTLVVGSSWPADEAVVLPAANEWLLAHPNARMIIAPHEPTAKHLDPIVAWARAQGVLLARLSEVEADATRARSDASDTREATVPWRVLLVDRVGVLGDLYALGDIAFVGGGLHNAGLHSVLEPAAFGIPVLFGPKHQNAREAGEMVKAGGACVVSTSAELREQLVHFTTHTDARARVGASAQSLVRGGLGSTARVVSLIESLLG
jgi:3-deoxy-D-manno-octulosonic-acid transferase